MDHGFANYWSRSATNVTTKSAMNPTISLCMIVIPACIGLIYVFDYPKILIPISVLLITLLVTFWQIIYFSIKDPDRLQNDRHVEAKMALNNHIIITENGTINSFDFDKNSKMINNPQSINTNKISGDS